MEAKAKEQTKISLEEMQSLLERVRQGELIDGDLLLIEKLIAWDIKLLSLLKKKKIKLKQIREFVFGPEKAEQEKDGQEDETKAAETEPQIEKEKKPRAPGHGRNSAEDYRGAKRVHCTDEELKIGSA